MPAMHINRLVEQVLSERAVELLDTMAAHALARLPQDITAVASLAVEADSWNDTVILMREIFEAEIQVAAGNDWLDMRILQSWGVKEGQLAWQFTPAFGQAIAAR
ncbi:hypothetical protein [Noviherbaspirillum aridicola]|uniref:Uncharacterized protein n=1 Tax=Noviherbaspirillum aridicola TaxID=2849687 RepID=A0ABQ4Q6N5_9BURK|nr:hypothetical protein [Noviherbaspirillum aridicola]GIZ52798.1 hypothetical protein NCCP691_28120 [Noviherbaspirillum aridicola]